MRVLVTGSRGFLGSALIPRLEAAGHDVTRLVRGRPGPGERSWDPAGEHLDPSAVDGMDAVVHLAAESIGSRRWSAAHRQRILDSRVRGTGLLASTLAGLSHPPAVLVSASAIGYYGNRGDEPVTEESGPGSGFLAEVCRAWESATAPAAAAGVRVVLARSGMVLSPTGGVLARQLPLFRIGLGGRLGSGRQQVSWISLDDQLGAMELALTDAGLSGPVNFTSPAPVTNAEFTRSLGRALHRPAVVRVPRFALALVLGRQMAEELLLWGSKVMPTRLEAAGYRFVHPTLDAAFGSLLAARR